MTTPRKLVMAAILVVLGLGVVEGLSWGAEWALWGAPYAEGRPVGLYVNRDGRKQLIPGAHLRGLLTDVQINSWGFRDDEVVEPPPPNALRIWCVGGSTTFDIYSRDGATAWPNLLQAKLQEALPDRAVDVLNAGIPGETFDGSLRDLEAWAPRFQPDLVVLYHGPNDLRQALLTQQGAAPVPKWALAIELQVFAFARLFMRLAASPPVPTGISLDLQKLDPVARWLHKALNKTRSLQARPVLVTHPLRVVRNEAGELTPAMNELAQQLMVPPDEAVAAYAWYNDTVRRIARNQGVPVAPVAEGIDASADNWGDLTHFRRAGAESAASILAETLLAHPVLLERRRGPGPR